MDTVEHTLYICREVSVFKIPPRSPAGHKSGEWKVADKIFTGRLRVTAIGQACELRLEDANNGELFGTCPVPQGQRSVAVEPVSDSSRYFVVRLLDQTSGRHAFVGLGFTDRNEAFDFNVALSDHEKQSHRASTAETSSGEASGPSWAAKEIAALDTGKDFSLKEGETIRVNVKKPASSGAGTGFLSQLGGSNTLTRGPSGGGLLAPPATSGPQARVSPRGAGLPSTTVSRQPQTQSQQWQQGLHQQAGGNAPTKPAQQQQQQSAQDGFMADFLGLNAPAGPAPQLQAAAPAQSSKVPDSWASFD